MRENTWCLSWNRFCRIMLCSFIHFPTDFLFLCSWPIKCYHARVPPFHSPLVCGWASRPGLFPGYCVYCSSEQTDRFPTQPWTRFPLPPRITVSRQLAALRSSFCSVECFQCPHTFYPMKQEDSAWFSSSSKCLLLVCLHFCFMSMEALPNVVSTMYASYFWVAL